MAPSNGARGLRQGLHGLRTKPVNSPVGNVPGTVVVEENSSSPGVDRACPVTGHLGIGKGVGALRVIDGGRLRLGDGSAHRRLALVEVEGCDVDEVRHLGVQSRLGDHHATVGVTYEDDGLVKSIQRRSDRIRITVKVGECSRIGSMPGEIDCRCPDTASNQQCPEGIPAPSSVPRSVNEKDRFRVHWLILPATSNGRWTMSCVPVPTPLAGTARAPGQEVLGDSSTKASGAYRTSWRALRSARVRQCRWVR